MSEHHGTQKIVPMSVFKVEEIIVPEGWHVVQIIPLGEHRIVAVLECNN